MMQPTAWAVAIQEVVQEWLGTGRCIREAMSNNDRTDGDVVFPSPER